MRKLGFILLPLVFVACTDTQPAAPDINVAPSFNFENAPEFSGPYVVRGEFQQLVSSFYTKTPDGNAWIGWTGVPQDPDDLIVCGAEESQAESFWFQSVERPDRLNDLFKGTDRRLVLWNADEFIPVWLAGPGPEDNDLCAALHLPFIVEGTATREINNDNDLFAQTRNNVWGYRLHGTAGDYIVNYHFKVRCNSGQGCRLVTEVGSVH